MESGAVLKHWRFEFTGNVIVTLSFWFVELESNSYGVSAIFGKFIAIFHLSTCFNANPNPNPTATPTLTLTNLRLFEVKRTM